MIDWRAIALALIERLRDRLDDVPGSPAERANTSKIQLALTTAKLDQEALASLWSLVK